MASSGAAGVPDEIKLWRQLVVLVSQVGAALDRRPLRQLGLSSSELMVLVELAHGDPRGMRVQDLASRVGLDQSSVSRLANRLDLKGFTTRVSCAHDRRGVYCGLTEEGRKLARQAEAVVREELARAFDTAAIDDRTASLVARLWLNRESRAAT
jgi:DNA-binding MarR family transcriptional regulator